MAEYDKGPGSIIVNMGLKETAPQKDFPFVVITGVSFKNCDSTGLPDQNEFKKLHEISDDIARLLDMLLKNQFAGTFTYQCERLDYIYLQDTNKIRAGLAELYKYLYADYKYSISIKLDTGWDAYLKFLYPNEETQEDIMNQKVTTKLRAAGDNLSKARLVDHWLYFKESSGMETFKKVVLKVNFKIEENATSNNPALPFKLHISRIDKVDLESINKVTLMLRREAEKYGGKYDGWETEIIKD